MIEKVKILIVEDDMIIAAKVSMQLTKLGYEVTGIVPRGEEAVRHVTDNKPDIVLLDINLKGKLDGVETAQQMHLHDENLPIIYVTANTDEATFNRAKATRPYAFIPKPIKNLDLQRAIELTISRMAEQYHSSNESEETLLEDKPFVMSDRIFVKHNGKMIKIFIKDILYLEAERNYCQLITKNQTYTLALTLKTMQEQLPSPYFIRIHRSYVANISQVDEVLDNYVLIATIQLPLSETYRDELLRHLQTF